MSGQEAAGCSTEGFDITARVLFYAQCKWTHKGHWATQMQPNYMVIWNTLGEKPISLP